jgi:large subunit ribosomal protein L21
MYAIIRSGGKQAKVAEGDVIDVEKLRADDEVTFTPLLVVDDSGTVFSKRADLADAKVVARVVGDSAGPKVDIFKYKNKTGYSRRQGHRQKYTTIEITSIVPPGAKKAAKKASDDAEKPAAKKPAAAKKAPAAEKAEKPVAEAPAEKPTSTDEEA